MKMLALYFAASNIWGIQHTLLAVVFVILFSVFSPTIMTLLRRLLPKKSNQPLTKPSLSECLSALLKLSAGTTEKWTLLRSGETESIQITVDPIASSIQVLRKKTSKDETSQSTPS